ncbi:YciI family protein [Actinoplanes sp. NPDC051343]|jgi:hypothetical protein|uniref:YciI family protein n=1 Tax=Actinoplanes sp. NPDC051343 TaxID=3363906 RepID=UPI0037B2A223
MRYAMIITGDESHWFGPAVESGLMDQVDAWWEKWHQAGKIVRGGAELDRSTKARTVGPGPDGPVVTDGPFLELKEVVGGFVLLEADDMDAAVEVAAGWPGIAHGDRIEVRPVITRE